MPNCCVVGCGYDLAPKDGTYESYRLPKDPKISQKWLKLINRPNYVPSSSTAVCHRHFEEDAFLSHEQNITKKGKQRKRRNLKPTALPTLFMPGNIRKTEIKREKVRSAMDLLFGNSNDEEVPHMEILENPKNNKIGDLGKQNDSAEQEMNSATNKDNLFDNKDTKSEYNGVENDESYIEIVSKPIIIKLIKPSLKHKEQLVENMEEAETEVVESDTILISSEKVPHTETISSHIETVSPHVEPISPHIEKISPHIQPLSPHIEKISPYIETISPHVDTISPHIETISEIDSSENQEISSIDEKIDENENQGGEMYFNDNPWKVENILDFNFFCCPECTFQSKEQLNFAIHAIENHILSRIFFKTSADNDTKG